MEAEASRPTGDLRDLPRLEIAPLLPVELRRLGEEQRLAGEVDAVAEDVGRSADLRTSIDEAIDLLPPRGERHGAVETGDTTGMEPVQLARQADHGAATERDDHRAGAETVDSAPPGPVERRLPLEEANLDPRERVPDERQRLDGAEQQDVAVLAAQQEPCPRRAALLVLRPLHLVEHEGLAARGRHLGGAAHDRRVGIDPLLARHEAHALLA